MLIVLDGERPMSWNKLYAGSHWTTRKEEADRVHMLVHCAVHNDRASHVRFNEPVNITITAYFDSRPLDASNLPAKIYEDGIVKCGLLKDDNPKYVSSMTTRSRIDKDRPRVEIEIVPA